MHLIDVGEASATAGKIILAPGGRHLPPWGHIVVKAPTAGTEEACRFPSRNGPNCSGPVARHPGFQSVGVRPEDVDIHTKVKPLDGQTECERKLTHTSLTHAHTHRDKPTSLLSLNQHGLRLVVDIEHNKTRNQL